MEKSVFHNISKIIERESKTTTYKFALLRGVIDIISENSPFIQVGAQAVSIPLGLMIEKWILYYYPIFESSVIIPQHNNRLKLAFQDELCALIQHYKPRGGLSAFYNDIRKQGIPKEIVPEFIRLVKRLRDTITNMPMRYLGSSIGNAEYSIFSCQRDWTRLSQLHVNLESVIESSGSFTIPQEYYEAFKILGSFISGTDSILFKWADFSAAASRDPLPTEKVLNEVLKGPITERDVLVAKQHYRAILEREGHVRCVWSGEEVRSYDVDHLIPFAIWKNNDLWNLLPAKAQINKEKRDKIPSIQTIQKKKDGIIHYWELLKAYQENRFFSELRVSLLGGTQETNWQNAAFNQLLNTSDYLINTRGYKAWEPKQIV